MGRAHFFTDRALVVRHENGVSFGAASERVEVEQGDWVPCRLREPSGDTDFENSRHELQPTHTLHFDVKDVAGRRVHLKQSDVLRIYQRIDDYWVEFGQPFRIIGAIQPKRRRTRLVSYTVDLYAPEVEY